MLERAALRRPVRPSDRQVEESIVPFVEDHILRHVLRAELIRSVKVWIPGGRTYSYLIVAHARIFHSRPT